MPAPGPVWNLAKLRERLAWARDRGMLRAPRGRGTVPPGPRREGGMVPRITVRVSCKTRVEKPPWGLAFGKPVTGKGWEMAEPRIFPPCSPPSVRAEEEQKAGECGDYKSSGASERVVKLSVAVSQRGGCCRLCLVVAVTSTRSAV